jgi:hypothetical protein
MIKENQVIETEEKDAPEFIKMVDSMLESIVAKFSVKEVVFVKIKNWFDHKWLNFSGITVVPFEFGWSNAFPNNIVLESVWRDKISIPPFKPSRVIYSRFYVTEVSENDNLRRPIHQNRHSNDNIHNSIADYTSDGLVLWFSSNSGPLQKGSLMVYRVQHAQVYTWYATIENINGWKLTKAKGISLDELRSYIA